MEDVWEDRTILMVVVGGWKTYPALVLKLNGLGRRRVCMDRRWRAFVVPCHDHWLELQPARPDEVIIVDFEKVESVIVREADGSIVSPSQQMSL